MVHFAEYYIFCRWVQSKWVCKKSTSSYLTQNCACQYYRLVYVVADSKGITTIKALSVGGRLHHLFKHQRFSLREGSNIELGLCTCFKGLSSYTINLCHINILSMFISILFIHIFLWTVHQVHQSASLINFLPSNFFSKTILQQPSTQATNVYEWVYNFPVSCQSSLF